MFLSIFSQTIVATAMPRIIADLGGFDRYTWPTTAYLVATAVAVPIIGRLSDIHGRRVFLIVGLVMFTLCSIPAGLSQSMTQLVASRVLQGIGGGLIVASSFAAAADLFPPQDRGGLNHAPASHPASRRSAGRFWAASSRTTSAGVGSSC